MCSLITLFRPGHRWPLLLAGNRDEMRERPWQPPARHWPDRPEVTAGLDRLANGSWMGVNDHGVAAVVLNRVGSLGPAPGRRSRGELVLEALDHAEARPAATALAQLEPRAYRPFNLVIGDARGCYLLRNLGRQLELSAVPPGLQMLTASDLNDLDDPRIARFLPRFRAAAEPRPEAGDWHAWQALLAVSDPGVGQPPQAATCFQLESGFGTRSSSLIALPDGRRETGGPLWLFAAGPPDRAPFKALAG